MRVHVEKTSLMSTYVIGAKRLETSVAKIICCIIERSIGLWEEDEDEKSSLKELTKRLCIPSSESTH